MRKKSSPCENFLNLLLPVGRLFCFQEFLCAHRSTPRFLELKSLSFNRHLKSLFSYEKLGSLSWNYDQELGRHEEYTKRWYCYYFQPGFLAKFLNFIKVCSWLLLNSTTNSIFQPVKESWKSTKTTFLEDYCCRY